MPRIAAEEHALARLGPDDLASLRIRQHQSALEDVKESNRIVVLSGSIGACGK